MVLVDVFICIRLGTCGAVEAVIAIAERRRARLQGRRLAAPVGHLVGFPLLGKLVRDAGDDLVGILERLGALEKALEVVSEAGEVLEVTLVDLLRTTELVKLVKDGQVLQVAHTFDTRKIEVLLMGLVEVKVAAEALLARKHGVDLVQQLGMGGIGARAVGALKVLDGLVRVAAVEFLGRVQLAVELLERVVGGQGIRLAPAHALRISHDVQ